jgi:uncharacterized protein (DUF1697 family)
VTHVVLLRGVNVGGHRTFRPAMLAKELQHFDVVNIGAAGTFVIRKPVSRTQLRAELASRLPFETHIMICGSREITRLLSHDWFARTSPRPDIVRFVSLLSRVPRLSPRLPLTLPGRSDQPPLASGELRRPAVALAKAERTGPTTRGQWLLRVLARDGRFVIGEYRRQMKAIGYLGTLDRLFGAPATTRNWNTIAAIAKVLDREAI